MGIRTLWELSKGDAGLISLYQVFRSSLIKTYSPKNWNSPQALWVVRRVWFHPGWRCIVAKSNHESWLFGRSKWKTKFLSLDSIFLEHFQTQDPAFVSTSQIFQDSFCGFPLPWRCSPDPFQPGTWLLKSWPAPHGFSLELLTLPSFSGSASWPVHPSQGHQRGKLRQERKNWKRYVTTFNALSHLEIHLIHWNLIRQGGHNTYFYFMNEFQGAGNKPWSLLL